MAALQRLVPPTGTDFFEIDTATDTRIVDFYVSPHLLVRLHSSDYQFTILNTEDYLDASDGLAGPNVQCGISSPSLFASQSSFPELPFLEH